MKSINILNSRFNIILVFIWFINDILLKDNYPGIITGKISDLIGLYITPFMLTGIIFIFIKKGEKIIFYLSIILVSIYFIFSNISQYSNDYIHGLISIGPNFKGTADITDIFCLLVLIFSIFIFEKKKLNMNQNRMILLMCFMVFINSPMEPSGRNNIGEYLFAISLSYDKIILIAPVKEEKINTKYNFEYQFIGSNNERSPRSAEEVKIPQNCEEINRIPEETDVPLSSTNNANLSMKFESYRIRISTNSGFTETNIFKDCKENKCELILEDLDSGLYFWSVGINYNFIRDCKLYNYIEYPRQEIQSFKI